MDVPFEAGVAGEEVASGQWSAVRQKSEGIFIFEIDH
jgi:hypothetical protein